MPRVSVCIPTHNTARYLPEAIESVLSQEFDDYELVICDNASTDQTTEICVRYVSEPVRYVRFEEFVGQAGNWNRCLDLATGEYVVLLHSDDALMSTFLKRAVATLDNNPEVALVHCSVQHVDQSGSPTVIQKIYDEDRIESGEGLLKKLLLEGCVVNPAGVMVRRKVYEQVGRFTEQIVWGVDWHMWMRIALRSGVAYLAEPLAIYRQHQQSGTAGVMATARNAKDEMWMLNDIFHQIPQSRADLQPLYKQAKRQSAHRTWCFAEEMCRLGFMPPARANLKRAVSIRPAMVFSPRFWSLWTATYIGYGWFKRLHAWKHRLAAGEAAPEFGKKL